MQTIEFYRNRKKTMNTIMYNAGILVLLAAILVYSTVIAEQLLIKGMVISIMLILFFGYFLIKSVAGLKDKRPLVLLQPEGLTSTVTPVTKAAGLVRWADITDARLEKVGADVLVRLTVRNAETYQQVIKKSSMVKGETDAAGNLIISLTASEIEPDAAGLLDSIQNYRKSLNLA